MKKAVLFFLLMFGFSQAQTNYYVSSVNGDDTNDGSEANPFKTIAKANEVLEAGGTCYLMQGVYRETVTVPIDNVTYKNYQNDYVVVTGLDVIENWTQHSGAIYKAASLDSITQVFVNGKHMDWARFPNSDGNMYNRQDMINIDISTKAPTGKATLKNIPARPKNYWQGGFLVGVSNGRNWWTAMIGRIKSSSADNKVQCVHLTGGWQLPINQFGGAGKGYILGAFNALDTANEWVYKDGEVFYQVQAGVNIDDLIIEGRTRVHGFDVGNKSNIRIEGLHIKAASVHMPQSNNCVISNCTIIYPGTFSQYRFDNTISKQRSAWGNYTAGEASGVYLGGNGNLIENTYIGKTWTHGVAITGNNNTINECEIGEVNWNAERFSCIFSRGNDNIITNNSLHDSAREIIDLGNRTFAEGYSLRAKIFNNDISRAGFLCPDSGIIYTNHQGGIYEEAKTEIAYNYIHDYFDPGNGKGGVYLDNGSAGYTVHHNIIEHSKRGVNVNDSRAKYRPSGLNIFNNTFIDVGNPVFHNYQGFEEGQRVTQLKVYNNLTNKGGFQGIDKQNNKKVSNEDFTSVANEDFTLKSSSSAIDFGLEITGITDGFVGSAPDAGALEFSQVPFEFGTDYVVPELLDEIVLKELIEGTVITEQVIEDAKEAIKKEQQRLASLFWHTNDGAKWTVTETFADNPKKKASLQADGARAWKQFFDLVSGVSYKAIFDYEISNKDGVTGAGLRISAHQGKITAKDFSNLAETTLTTNAIEANPEIGSGSITFIPTGDNAYIVVHKIGTDGDKTNAKISNLTVEQTNLSSSIYDKIPGLSIAVENRTIVVKGARLEQVFTVTGQLTTNNNLANGVYIVKLANGTTEVTGKVLVKQ